MRKNPTVRTYRKSYRSRPVSAPIHPLRLATALEALDGATRCRGGSDAARSNPRDGALALPGRARAADLSQAPHNSSVSENYDLMGDAGVPGADGLSRSFKGLEFGTMV